LGSLRRIIQCVAIDNADNVMYCGTQTGDLLEVNAKNGRFIRAGRNRFSQGISVVSYIQGRAGEDNAVLVGNGDGSVAVIPQKTLHVDRSAQLLGKVTSVSVSGDGLSFFAGTDAGNTYRVRVSSLEAELLSTAHFGAINDICFPVGCSDLCITCSKTDIRVWNVATHMELLRIQVPNLECMCVTLSPNGRSIVSGWDDGKIRAFFPQSGKLQYVISDAHAECVTALAITSDNGRVVSGGRDGRVRVWNVSGQTQVMEHSFKEHKRKGFLFCVLFCLPGVVLTTGVSVCVFQAL
jgi:cilia- and flagella-associated protein 52